MKNKVLKISIISSIFLICYLIIGYLTLPVINLQSFGFHIYLGILIGFIITMILYGFQNKIINHYNKPKARYKRIVITNNQIQTANVSSKDAFNGGYFAMVSYGVISAIIIVFSLVALIIGSKMFRANDYYKQLVIEEGTSEEFNDIYSYQNEDVLLPTIDKDLAFRLAEARLADYGAQYSIDYENFTIISVKENGEDKLVRIAPLEYSNLFVSLSRMNKGTIGFVVVNVVTKEAKLHTFEDGLKYMPTSKFSYDLDRHIRFNYPTKMYNEKYFEIDDEGIPYWVVPTYENEISVFSGAMSKGVIVCNAINGDINYYDLGEEPSWVDRSTYDTLIETQATNALRYKNGYINATFGAKKEVFQVSDGYNYYIKNGHTYYVSCVTSPNENDQTSIGFITIDLKTRHAVRYSIPGITEMRAREIAMMDERVKAQSLAATWPILINYEGVPTYFVVLKNDVQAQKIVFINVSDGALVAMGNNFREAEAEYNNILASTGQHVSDIKETIGIVTKIRDLGETIEFMLDNNDDTYFVVSVSLSLDARFITVGDQVLLKYRNYGSYNYVTEYQKNKKN